MNIRFSVAVLQIPVVTMEGQLPCPILSAPIGRMALFGMFYFPKRCRAFVDSRSTLSGQNCGSLRSLRPLRFKFYRKDAKCAKNVGCTVNGKKMLFFIRTFFDRMVRP